MASFDPFKTYLRFCCWAVASALLLPPPSPSLPTLPLPLPLSSQVAHIASYQPESLVVPMVMPASYLAVDTTKHSIVLVVRGTTSWKDAFTDIVAHTVPLGTGDTGKCLAEGESVKHFAE